MYNASNSALGAVLGQRVGKQPHVIAYASRTMDLAQVNYTTTKKELLIIVFSDHAVLKFLLKKPDAKPRLIRWMLFLQEFDLEIRDKKGAKNAVADHLSQLEREVDPLPIRDEFSDEQILQLTHATPWYANICNFLVASTYPKELPKHTRTNMEAKKNTTYGMTRTYGEYAMINRFSTFVMQRPEEAIIDLVEQLGKSSTMGYTGPPYSETHTKLFGVPKALISDQGSHFYNYAMATLLEKYGVVHQIATTYHLQTNSQAEMFNRKIKKLLQKMANPNKTIEAAS
ncbi:Retrovirus-related Pol polyprotein from transposon 17.6, partial [Mucuna pruriens]